MRAQLIDKGSAKLNFLSPVSRACSWRGGLLLGGCQLVVLREEFVPSGKDAGSNNKIEADDSDWQATVQAYT
jgi:hypothetical protein